MKTPLQENNFLLSLKSTLFYITVLSVVIQNNLVYFLLPITHFSVFSEYEEQHVIIFMRSGKTAIFKTVVFFYP